MATFAISGLIKVVFNGRNGAGPIDVPGLKAGDYVLNIQPTATTNPGNAQGEFQCYVGSDDVIFQDSGSDLSSTEFTAFLIRA